ncbi:MAG: hypothetical protein BGO34_16925 [Bacteroidia bacterium 44-10]|nr:MAG: hypothetical protein BGO34_16925 [Bacteroidia bacterium 44-10]
MKINEQSPDRSEPIQGDIILKRQGKDSTSLSKRQRKVYDILRTGKYSATDITIALGYCDPRSYIRDLREKGITVLDEWVENEETKYKRYFIPAEITDPKSNPRGSLQALDGLKQNTDLNRIRTYESEE